jgi:DNA-binding SARP family transcriptional activator/tetratricopeptide (TPR) repeat protein
MMLFEVLGPMRVTDAGGAHPVAGVRQRILLGALLAHANQPLPAEKLAEIVWDGAPPQRAVPTLRTYLTRLRQDLGPDAASRIRTGDGGYLAEVGGGDLDALDFEALCHDAGAAIREADWAAASDRAARALALWRATPLADVPSQVLRDMWLPRLEQQHLQVGEWRIEAELRLGQHEQLIAPLRRLIAEHPLRERLHAQLMRALARCGRQAEALAAYTQARAILVEELGIEPGPELRHLHERILAGDGAPSPPAAEPVPGGSAVAAVPRQLPAAAGNFTGRERELDLLTRLPELSRATGAPGGTVVISAINGMAGVGKTALAVHAAHRLARMFPDGQLFLDLHGHAKGYPPREPEEALGALLRAQGVPAGQIPAQPEECAALFRQRLAGTRTLILLDNALNEAQVRPLLPGTPGCLVMITSRQRLKGLHDAHVVALDVLPEADALTLLHTVTAPAHATADDAALAEIAGLCGRLPLALRIAGALLRHRPAWTPAYLAGLLQDEHERLAALADGDHDLRAAFALSYTGLDEPQRLLFRRLALVPGPELDAFAAAALLDAAPAAAARLLESLVDHNLLVEHAPGRYRLHDLIRAHARTLADSDPRPDRDSARDRLLAYYAHTAQRASALIARYPRPAPGGPPPASAPALDGHEVARAWLRTERDNLEAACRHARGLAMDAHYVALTAGLSEIIRIDGPLADALELHQAAIDTAERHAWSGDRAAALTDLASVRRLTGDTAGATEAARRAVETYRAIGHRHGEANALAELGRGWLLSGNLAGAADAATRALAIYQAVGNRIGEANALAKLCHLRILTGDLSGAAEAATQGLEIFRTIGNRNGEANALTDLANVRILTGDHGRAADAATQALEIFRTIGHRNGEANALTEVCRVRLATGDYARAADAATVALEIFRAVGHRNGEANALTCLGRVRLAAADLPAASDALSGALEIFRAIGSRSGEGCALNDYAAVVAAAGDLPRALDLYQQSLAMNRELNKPDDEAIALEGIGEYHLSGGRAETAATHLNQALEIYERLGMTPSAERVRARLNR